MKWNYQCNSSIFFANNYLMRFIKNCKTKSKTMKKASKTIKNDIKSVKYVILPKLKASGRIKRCLDKNGAICSEYKLKDNFALIEKAEAFVNSRSKIKYRKTDEIIVIKCARKIVQYVIDGLTISDAVIKSVHEFRLYKKEVQALRKATIYIVLANLLNIETILLEIKSDIQRGLKVKSDNVFLTPGMCYGITKSCNLGLFIDREKDIKNGLDLLVIDCEEYGRQIDILINLLIKCMQ